jgi:hypothetical protein
MATVDRPQSAQQKVMQFVLLGVVEDALNLVQRFQEGQGFKSYVLERLRLIVPVGLLILITSIGCAAATVLYIGGTRSALVLLAILLVPFVLLGSFFVQAYVFAAWLETRALAKALHHSPAAAGALAAKLRKAGINVGSIPPVPWALAALFLLLPLAMLIIVVPKVGIALVALLIAAPVAFARLDR